MTAHKLAHGVLPQYSSRPSFSELERRSDGVILGTLQLNFSKQRLSQSPWEEPDWVKGLGKYSFFHFARMYIMDEDTLGVEKAPYFRQCLGGESVNALNSSKSNYKQSY